MLFYNISVLNPILGKTRKKLMSVKPTVKPSWFLNHFCVHYSIKTICYMFSIYNNISKTSSIRVE